jgi:hypothetical protein
MSRLGGVAFWLLLAVVVGCAALTPDQVLELEDDVFLSGDQWKRAQELWELRTAMPLYFYPTTEALKGEGEEVGVKALKAVRAEGVFVDWRKEFLSLCHGKTIVAGKTGRGTFVTCLEPKLRDPCKTPDRDDLIKQACAQDEGMPCASGRYCIRHTFYGHEMEHIVGEKSGEMSAWSSDVLGNVVMAVRSWNGPVGKPGNVLQKVKVYGKLLSYAARFWVEWCKKGKKKGASKKEGASEPEEPEPEALRSECVKIRKLSPDDPKHVIEQFEECNTDSEPWRYVKYGGPLKDSPKLEAVKYPLPVDRVGDGTPGLKLLAGKTCA